MGDVKYPEFASMAAVHKFRKIDVSAAEANEEQVTHAPKPTRACLKLPLSPFRSTKVPNFHHRVDHYADDADSPGHRSLSQGR